MHSPNESAASGARDIRMVDSRVEGYGATYGTLSDSRQSGSSASREQTSPVNPTQQPTQYTSSSAYALRPGTAPSSGLYVPTTTQGQYGLQGTTQGGQGAIQGSGSGSQGTSATSGQTQGAYGSLGTYGAQGSSYGSSQSSSGQSALYSSSTGGSNIPSYQPVTGTSLYQSSLRGNVQGSTTGSVSGSGLPSYQSTAAYQSTTGYQGATYSSSGYTVSQSGATGTGSQYPTQPGAGKESKK